MSYHIVKKFLKIYPTVFHENCRVWGSKTPKIILSKIFSHIKINFKRFWYCTTSYTTNINWFMKKVDFGVIVFRGPHPTKIKILNFFWWKLQTPKYVSIKLLEKFQDLILPEICLKYRKIQVFGKSFWGTTTSKIQILWNFSQW